MSMYSICDTKKSKNLYLLTFVGDLEDAGCNRSEQVILYTNN